VTIVECAVRGLEFLLQAGHFLEQYALFYLVPVLLDPRAQGGHALGTDLAAQAEQTVRLPANRVGIVAARGVLKFA
jgi:hypothetical protein